MPTQFRTSMRRLLIAGAASCAVFAGPSAAQDKAVVVERVEPYPALTRWVNRFVPMTPLAVTTVQPLRVVLGTRADGPPFEPQPIIIGRPELPLLGDGVAEAAERWGPALNYQGLHMNIAVIGAAGTTLERRPMSARIRPGERFKVRITATFPALAAVEQIAGSAWQGRRLGQVYPQAGMSVQMNAGETVELPLAEHDYFVMDQPGSHRMLVTVRHAKALDEARSSQPAYRQDEPRGSNYLQLVPRGSYPAIEQLVSQAQ